MNDFLKQYSAPVRIIARVGFFAKGIIYFTIGILAIQIALGIGGDTSGATQILKKFIYKPFGIVLLIFCLSGFLAHALWKLINGFLDVEQNSTGTTGILFRVVEIIVGFLYLSLSYATLQILMGKGAESSDQSTQIWIAKILTLPYGKWIVFIAALVVVIIGGYQFYYAYTDGFEYRFNFNQMSSKEDHAVHLLGKIGLSAWGVVYFMIAFLLYQSAVQANPKKAGGLGDALSALAKQPYGPWVLGITSAGLIIYGVYLFALSYYHKMYS